MAQTWILWFRYQPYQHGIQIFFQRYKSEFLRSKFSSLFSALEWHGKYQLFRLLQSNGILPGFDHQIQDVIKALNNAFGGRSPALSCRKYNDFENPILSQVKLCFDKSMTLVDCYSVMPWQKVFDSCPTEGLVFYPRYEQNYKKVEYAGNPLLFHEIFKNEVLIRTDFRCNYWTCHWTLCNWMGRFHAEPKVWTTQNFDELLDRGRTNSGYTFASRYRTRSLTQHNSRNCRYR